MRLSVQMHLGWLDNPTNGTMSVGGRHFVALPTDILQRFITRANAARNSPPAQMVLGLVCLHKLLESWYYPQEDAVSFCIFFWYRGKISKQRRLPIATACMIFANVTFCSLVFLWNGRGKYGWAGMNQHKRSQLLSAA